MDIKKIKKLISLVETSQISALCIEEDNTKIEIKKEALNQIHQTHIQPVQQTPLPIANEPEPTITTPKQETNSNLIEIKSPMVGTYYSAANPESEPFVSVGKTIQTGNTICIIEAMKLFNEIESEVSGTIETICVNNGDSVEFGQVLFLVQPN